ncbi:PREDICTED: receptor-like serine/threonine-protein kinase SD1-8 isoform X1 [Camelina sativa]|uniref:Receptor-like serine/threonine-protein kinase n=2 Tax=Camelina sativa TaxID=90675 RepID=A0ABM0UDA8_CAMSA|nr:PREDICTED: receptor-like serine/threonine-protein kinase SD1-8 isoform X1 [Camelina sativa]
MRGDVPNFHHSYTFFLFLVFLILLFPTFSISSNTLSTTESVTISSNKTIVSPGDVFELGFFKPGSSSRWYLGIWYKTISKRTYVWVANRDNPLSSSVGTLKISDNNLVVLDQSETPVWSTNLTGGSVRSPVVAELLDNGNFVLRDSNSNNLDEYLWQSFDFPTDTLLPEMKLGWDLKTGFSRFIRSWKNSDDPSSGDYSFKLETGGFPEIFLWNRESRVYRSGPWNGVQFSGVPEMQRFDYMVFNFTASKEEVTYSFRVTKDDIYSRLSLSSTGVLERFTWIEAAQTWNRFWYAPKDQCDDYKECGVYGYCDSNTSPVCNCIKGFKPRNPQVWGLRDGSDGCVRKTLLTCGGKEGFARLKKMKLPDTTAASVDRGIGVKECEQKCLKDCNCTAFANTDIRGAGSGCVIWTGELLDIRNYAKGGQDLYVRLAATDIEDKRNRSAKIIGSSIGVISVLLILSFIIFCLWKRKQKQSAAIETPIVDQVRSRDLLMNEVVISSRRHISRENNTDDLELPLMEFEEVAMATNNFSNENKLGQGGFGIVYKGRLLDGQEIAVKRLSKTSVQGTDEFKNEVKLIARLQHINLVRLLACCVDVDEKMLIYEYLANLSLDSHLFDKKRSSKLNWQMRFDIINGIARGLLYLHQDSRFRIIHRDLKASNVLLDQYMTPKISDFGMARIFGRDDTEAITRKVVGTYGYMSPEYAMDGIFSMKSDVFSFGVLLLEIISGKRNKGFYNSDRDLNLLGCVWRNWKEGKGLEIIDPSITNSSSTFRQHEILRCIQIGLLCVQERAEDRPTMSLVVLMLGSESTSIPQPKPPGYCMGRSPLDTDSSSSKRRDDELWTVNQITVSVLDGR